MTAISLPVPEHVPPEFVYDFDLYRDPAYLAEPNDRLTALLRRYPFAISPRIVAEDTGGKIIGIGTLPIVWNA